MGNYKVLRFENKKILRKILRLGIIDSKISSLYKCEDNTYVVVDIIKMGELVKLNHIQVCSNLSAGLITIYDWGMSEILQTIALIKFETDSFLTPIGRGIMVGNITIIRLFDYLSENFIILNYTKDSFSDGGKYNNLDRLLDYACLQIENGASIIDIGVESTNPISIAMGADIEIKKLSLILGELVRLKGLYKIKISVDTYHKDTITWLLDKDIDIINDVSGRLDSYRVRDIVSTQKEYLAMHSIVIPAKKNVHLPIKENPVEVIYCWMEQKLQNFDDYGINLDYIILDPGIGFGINSAQSWYVMKNFAKFYNLPCELLLGHSRKSFFTHIIDKSASNRDLDTAMVSMNFVNKIDYLRVHDIRVFNQLYGIRQQICR